MSESNENSADLLRLAATGDAEAFERVVRIHGPSLLAFLRARVGQSLGTREAASDILQDVLLQAAEGLARFDYRGEAQFRGWLFTLAENRLRERVRHHRRARRDIGRERPLSDSRPDHSSILQSFAVLLPADQAQQEAEDLARLQLAFDSLSDADKEVLSLSAFCGMNAADIAAHLGLDEEAARKRRTRARVRLADAWRRRQQE